jgi:hypothetical protein
MKSPSELRSVARPRTAAEKSTNGHADQSRGEQCHCRRLGHPGSLRCRIIMPIATLAAIKPFSHKSGVRYIYKDIAL